MREVERVLDGGIVEKRFYDKDNKLVDIRKTYPPAVMNDHHRAVQIRRRSVRGYPGRSSR